MIDQDLELCLCDAAFEVSSARSFPRITGESPRAIVSPTPCRKLEKVALSLDEGRPMNLLCTARVCISLYSVECSCQTDDELRVMFANSRSIALRRLSPSRTTYLLPAGTWYERTVCMFSEESGGSNTNPSRGFPFWSTMSPWTILDNLGPLEPSLF